MTTPLRSKIPDWRSHQSILPKHGNWPAARHRFTLESLWALDMAILTQRPLLIRGEPGIGKSQIARAAAKELGVPFLSHVIDERSERDDLLYHYDAVSRLAHAQVSSVLIHQRGADGQEHSPETLNLPETLKETMREMLAEDNFFRPGVLWWALNWKGAEEQRCKFEKYCRSCPPPAKEVSGDAQTPCGPVVLIDEIDKADPSLPNGLLECLGTDGFRSPHLGRDVSVPEGGRRPLIVFTTNEERELPAAFLRRCLVLPVSFPKSEEEARKFLVHERARVWYDSKQISDDVCFEVAAAVLSERAQTASLAVPGIVRPGAAEFLDLVRALVEFANAEAADNGKRDSVQRVALNELKGFALRKSAGE